MHTSVQSLPLEPNWQSWSRQSVSSIPERVRPWLQDKGSLTRRVMGACRSSFSVRLLHQGWGRPLYSEQALLGGRRGGAVIVREVELMCGDHPWVFARSLIPASSLRGPARRLAHMGKRPLGELLFADSHVERGIVEVARLLPRHPLFVAATANLIDKPNELWGRRTLYFYSGKPLLVNEIFLPEIPRTDCDVSQA